MAKIIQQNRQTPIAHKAGGNDSEEKPRPEQPSEGGDDNTTEPTNPDKPQNDGGSSTEEPKPEQPSEGGGDNNTTDPRNLINH
ncbi:hypothetical protein ABLV92_13325 [Staphylococcus equorum]